MNDKTGKLDFKYDAKAGVATVVIEQVPGLLYPDVMMRIAGLLLASLMISMDEQDKAEFVKLIIEAGVENFLIGSEAPKSGNENRSN